MAPVGHAFMQVPQPVQRSARISMIVLTSIVPTSLPKSVVVSVLVLRGPTQLIQR